MAEWQGFQELGSSFAKIFGEMKDGQARFEMNDLELKSLEILRAKPFLAEVFSDAWDYWMVDEYQDTSPLQAEILQTLIGAKPRILVGDPQQSIYLFRGADVAVFDRAEKAVFARGGSMVRLAKNYRSAPALLLWINDFMAAMSEGFMRMEPRAEKAEGETAPVTLFRAADAQAELNGIVAQVGELLSRGARLEEICIISRTHRSLLETSLRLKEFGYPTHVHASRGFNSRREIVDAQALWKFLANPHDILNLLVLLRSPGVWSRIAGDLPSG